MSYTFDNLPNAALLRADSHSQKTSIDTSSGTQKNLVSENQFWGDEQKQGLYYSYQTPNNPGYTLAHEGWSYFCHSDSRTMDAEKTAEWIREHVLTHRSKNLCVFQGYAGCGKTTLVYDILRQAKEMGSYSDYHDLYIGYNKDIDESLYIISSLQNSIVNKIVAILKEDDGMLVYKKFIDFFSIDLSKLNPLLSTHFSSLFSSDSNASLLNYAKAIYENRNSPNEALDKEYRVQFNTAFETKIAKFLYYNKTFKRNTNPTNDCLNILVYFDLLWHCAVSVVKKTTNAANHLIIYDNLDIIDNHEIVANFIDTLVIALSNYCDFKQKLEDLSDEYHKHLPSFKAILTVRKITYSEISKFFEVRNNERKITPPDIDFLDVSCLYPPANVLKYKSGVFLNNLDEYVPNTAKSYNRIKDYLTEINQMSDELFSEIKVSELFNQNIRACANIFDQVISSSSYEKHIKVSKNLSVSAKSAIWIHIICKILKDNKVWDNLGYNSNSLDDTTHPTTLSRMILTLLSNYKQGFYEKIDNFDSCDVSFKDIVQTFENFPFCDIRNKSEWNESIQEAIVKKCSKNDTRERIIETIAKMLQRNELKDKNNNSVEDLELWRRPIFYTKNSFSIIDINTTKNYLRNQINNFNNPNYPITRFCITDEGSTFVEKIATHFEFASIRFNDNNAVPLCCINDEILLDSLISTVYNEVKNCVKKQVWLVGYFGGTTIKGKNVYLKKNFHPRTESNKPQLHIVRMIYDHINYLNSYREILDSEGKARSSLDICLTKWIGKYLQLYNYHLFDLLKDTVGKNNNNVWLDLKYLYWLVYEDKTNGKFVSINRFNEDYNRITTEKYVIRDEELINKAMIIK